MKDILINNYNFDSLIALYKRQLSSDIKKIIRIKSFVISEGQNAKLLLIYDL